jgi:23S rRNA (uracil1939-C5)-methyltransferase
VKLRVEKAVYGGAGLAHIPRDESPDSDPRLAGKTVFIPYALPGELVEAHIVDDRRGFSTAELDRVIEPASERVSPHCEYFPVCGGCQYQQASAQHQLQIKLDILRDTLGRAHLQQFRAQSPGESVINIGATASSPWSYRNRIRLHIASASGADGPTLCYRERGSHANLPVTHCPIAAPVLEQAIAAVLRMGKNNGLARLSDEIEFFTNGEGDQLLISLWTARPESLNFAELLRDFAGQLQSQLPMLTGLGVFSPGERGDELLTHWGQRSLLYTVAGHAYRVSLGSFFQVNRFLLHDLLKLVVENGSGAGRSGQLAWDLYAGVGLFTLALGFEQVIAVEAAPLPAADLEQNLAGTPHRAVRSTALDFLRAQCRRRPRVQPGLILLDPPRAGLGKEACEHLAEIAAPEIVYVSCDPATLARDLQTLLHSGYRIESLHLVDLFPQTFHLESVAVLKR